MKNLIVIGQVTGIRPVLAAEHPHLSGDSRVVTIDGIVRDTDDNGIQTERDAKVAIWFGESLIESAGLEPVLFVGNYVNSGYEVRIAEKTTYVDRVTGETMFHEFSHNGATLGDTADGETVSTTNASDRDVFKLGIPVEMIKLVREDRAAAAKAYVPVKRVFGPKFGANTTIEDMEMLIKSYEEKASLPDNASSKNDYAAAIVAIKAKIKATKAAAEKAKK